nr:MAG TPA: hypothetical protein [Caudoviricetes sp.]
MIYCNCKYFDDTICFPGNLPGIFYCISSIYMLS